MELIPALVMSALAAVSVSHTQTHQAEYTLEAMSEFIWKQTAAPVSGCDMMSKTDTRRQFIKKQTHKNLLLRFLCENE